MSKFKHNFMMFFLVILLATISSNVVAGTYGSYPVGLPPDLWENHTASGLIKISHDLNGNGKIDLELIYTVRATFWTDVDPESLLVYYPGKLLLTVPVGGGLSVVVIGEHPLYYWYDTNNDGKCDIVFHDPTESGFINEVTGRRY